MAHELSGQFALAADWYRKALASTELPEHNGDFEDIRDDLRPCIASVEARLAETHAQPAEAGELSP